jgi:crotonobetaine/carnitine-CoA ligase
MDIANIALADRTLGRVFDHMLATSPDQLALRDVAMSLTYRETWERGLSFGRSADAWGVGWQEPVALMLDNHVDNVLCWLGLALTGRLEVAINVAYKGEMLAHILQDSGTKLLIVEEEYLSRVLEVAAQAPKLQKIVVRRAGDGKASACSLPHTSMLIADQALEASWDEPPASPAEVRPWDLISISYTSGTTGRSKGVLCPHSHAFGHAAADGVGRTAAGETRFVVLPQFHIAGRWGGVYNAFLHGACAFIADRFHASTFWRDAKAAGARTSQLVGSMAEFIMRQPPHAEDRGHGLREIGIMPLPHEPEKWAERFGVDITTCYGSTELGAVLETVSVIGNGVGRPRPGYEIRLVDEHDREVEPNQTGELAVRPLLPWTSSTGYLNRPDQTAEAWRNGWLHSGDALARDTHGNYVFVDRIDDALRRRGENISSIEVEYLIAKHVSVREVAVIGVPSEYLEDDLLAVIVRESENDVTEFQLVTQLAEILPYFMVPRYIRFVDDLPKTATEKVQKKVLKALGIQGAWDAQAAGHAPRK